MRLSFGHGLDYAVEVHEKVERYHPKGRAKFLESAVLESATDLPDAAAGRVADLFNGD